MVQWRAGLGWGKAARVGLSAPRLLFLTDTPTHPPLPSPLALIQGRLACDTSGGTVHRLMAPRGNKCASPSPWRRPVPPLKGRAPTERIFKKSVQDDEVIAFFCTWVSGSGGGWVGGFMEAERQKLVGPINVGSV